MSWIYLVIAGIFEVVWAVSLKYSHGFTRLVPSVVTIVGMLVSFLFLSWATKKLPIGTAYAIWTGIGVLGTVIIGIFAFHESVSPLRIVFLLMIFVGIVGLKLTA